MANKALTTCIFLAFAALAGANSGGGDLEPTAAIPRGCDAARGAYNDLVGATDESNDAVYKQLRNGECGKDKRLTTSGLIVCVISLNLTC